MAERIMHASNVSVVDYLRPNLICDDEEETRDVIIQNLIWYLENRPNEIQILCAFGRRKEDDEPELRAFTITIAPAGSHNVIVLQAWSMQKTEDPRIMDKMFLRIIYWAQGAGRLQITMETRRDPRAFTKRWGFKPISTIMGRDIGPDYEQTLIDALSHKEVIGVEHGQGQQQTIDDQQPERSTESSGPAVESDPAEAAGDGSGSGSVPGESGSEPGTGVQLSAEPAPELQSGVSAEPANSGDQDELEREAEFLTRPGSD